MGYENSVNSEFYHNLSFFKKSDDLPIFKTVLSEKSYQ